MNIPKNTYTCGICLKHYSRKNVLRNHCRKHLLTSSFEDMPVKLPGQWSYTDCHFRTETSVATFIIHNFGSIEQIKQWVAAFMQQNKSKYVCRRTYQKRHKNMELCYKAIYKCEHHMDPMRRTVVKRKIKGTGCKSEICFFLTRGLAEVKLSITHNHPLERKFNVVLNETPTIVLVEEVTYTEADLAEFNEFKKNWNDIFEIMQKNLHRYSRGIRYMNWRLSELKTYPPKKILQSLLSFQTRFSPIKKLTSSIYK